MGDPNQTDQPGPMWAPYGFVPFGMQPQNAHGQSSEQIPMQMAMMNPMMSPMMNPMMAGMMRGSAYGQMQFSPQMMMPQIPNQLQLAQHDDEEDIDADDIAANYPSANWNQQGMQPMIYPMMMVMPYNQQTAAQYPDVVEDGVMEEYPSRLQEEQHQHADHSATPDLVRGTIETEPTYANEQQQPSYANANILLEDEVATHQNTIRQQKETPRLRPTRAQSVQPTTQSNTMSPKNSRELNHSDHGFNTLSSPRSVRSQSVMRTYPLSKSLSTASNIQKVTELNRPATVLHIPDIKPRSIKVIYYNLNLCFQVLHYFWHLIDFKTFG